jgi:hypothetical protein
MGTNKVLINWSTPLLSSAKETSFMSSVLLKPASLNFVLCPLDSGSDATGCCIVRLRCPSVRVRRVKRGVASRQHAGGGHYFNTILLKMFISTRSGSKWHKAR